MDRGHSNSDTTRERQSAGAPEAAPPVQKAPRPPSVYDPFRRPGGGYDFQAMFDAGFDPT